MVMPTDLMAGQITLERGDLAKTLEEPEHRRLFRCEALVCQCGAEEHGWPAPTLNCFSCGSWRVKLHTHYHLRPVF